MRNRERVDLDVGQDACSVLAQAFGHKLLDPQAQNATTFLRQERELVPARPVVVIEERRKADCGIVDAILAALELGLDGVQAIAIANQRETTVLWERGSGRPVCPAVVWQDVRGEDLCRELAAHAESLFSPLASLTPVKLRSVFAQSGHQSEPSTATRV